MREVRTYDDARNPVWRSALAPGEYAVFHVDAKTGRHVTPTGTRLPNHWERTCLVFPFVEEAVAYAEKAVRATPTIACRVFASDVDEPVEVVRAERAARVGDPKRARRRLAWGSTLVALGVVGILVDWHFEWYYLLGVLLGVKFLTVGAVRLVEAYVELRSVRAERQRHRVES